MFRSLFLILPALPILALAVGCNDTGFTTSGLSPQTNGTDPLGPTVCDPFGSGGTVTKTNGIEATLTYLPSTSPVIYNTLSTASFAPGAPDVVTSPVRLILSQLAVSTRPFTEGFQAKDTGEKLEDLNGNVLDEYFSVRATSHLRLAAGDLEGDYELAILSDDGSILSLDPNGSGNEVKWIDNDGTHPNSFFCAAQPLHLTATSDVPIKVNYYQGPRVRIALMLLWRLKTASTTPEMECGNIRDDYYFFTPVGTDPSVPTANYTALLSRGWKPIAAANYFLGDNKTNPCAP